MTEIQKNGKRILQFYASKCDNLEEMDTFLEAYNLLRLYQGEIDNPNRLITSSKIEFVIKKKKNKLSANESLGLDSFKREFYQT